MKITHLRYTSGDGAHSFGSARADHEGTQFLISFYGTQIRSLRRKVAASRSPWGAYISAHHRTERSKKLLALAKEALLDYEAAQYEQAQHDDGYDLVVHDY